MKGRRVPGAANVAAWWSRAVHALVLIAAGLLPVLPLAGKAAPYHVPSLTIEKPEFWDFTCGKNLRDWPVVEFSKMLPPIREGGDPGEDIETLTTQGFLLVGMAQWDSLDYDPSAILPVLARWGPSDLVVYHLEGGSHQLAISPPVAAPLTSYSVCSVPQDAAFTYSDVVRYDTRRHVVLAWVRIGRVGVWGIGGDAASPGQLSGSGYSAGLSVKRVVEGLPASGAGLRVGDVIVEAGGRPAPTLEMLSGFRVTPLPNGLLLRVWRDGRLLDMTMQFAR